MHRQTGIAAALASAIITLAAEPASADPGPIPPLPAIDVSVPVDALPQSSTSATTDTTEAKAAKPTSAQPIKTAPTTREHALNTSYGPSRSAVRQTTTAAHSPAPSPTLGQVATPPPSAHGSISGRQGGGLDELTALLAIGLVAVVAMAFSRRRGKGYAAGYVDGATGRPAAVEADEGRQRHLRRVK